MTEETYDSDLSSATLLDSAMLLLSSVAESFFVLLRWPNSLATKPCVLDAGWSVLVVRLKMEPNPMAMTVHTKQMTL